MSDRQRMHREDAVRTEPIRNWSALYRRSDSWKERSSAASGQSSEPTPQEQPLNDVVSHGVKLGYRVVEDHIRHGQRIAQEVNNRSYSPGAFGNDIRETIERLARYYTDLGSLWGELVNSLVSNPDVINNLQQLWQRATTPAATNGTSAHNPEGPEAHVMTAVTIDVIASQPTQVTLDLYPQSERLLLTTHGLRSVDPDKPPLTNISFVPGSDHSPVCLRVHIPNDQPPDTYTGIIVEQATNRPRGTLSVRVGA